MKELKLQFGTAKSDVRKLRSKRSPASDGPVQGKAGYAELQRATYAREVLPRLMDRSRLLGVLLTVAALSRRRRVVEDPLEVPVAADDLR